MRKLIVSILTLSILFSLFATSALASTPQLRNLKRKHDVTIIMNALATYAAGHSGALPTYIPPVATEISSSGVNLCASLVPAYLPSFPVDPSINNGISITNCSSPYHTGYFILQSIQAPTGYATITISAPYAELGASILVKRNISNQSLQRNQQRTNDVNSIANAVVQYASASAGAIPVGITTTNQDIRSTGANICSSLVPSYLSSLPVDPILNTTPITNCATSYDTQYFVVETQANPVTVTVSAPNAENGVTIATTVTIPNYATQRNNQRTQDITNILNAIASYAANHQGALPAVIPTVTTQMSSTGVNLCPPLIPTYLSSFPEDPLINGGMGITNCSLSYDTGYTIIQSTNPPTGYYTLTVSAPMAELGASITVTQNIANGSITRNNQRTSDVNVLLSAIAQYATAHAEAIPTGITSLNQDISSTGANICSQLVPIYMTSLPGDPLFGIGTPVTNCTTAYDTGYFVQSSVGNTNLCVTVTAPYAELGASISSTQCNL